MSSAYIWTGLVVSPISRHDVRCCMIIAQISGLHGFNRVKLCFPAFDWRFAHTARWRSFRYRNMQTLHWVLGIGIVTKIARPMTTSHMLYVTPHHQQPSPLSCVSCKPFKKKTFRSLADCASCPLSAPVVRAPSNLCGFLSEQILIRDVNKLGQRSFGPWGRRCFVDKIHRGLNKL